MFTIGSSIIDISVLDIVEIVIIGSFFIVYSSIHRFKTWVSDRSFWESYHSSCIVFIFLIDVLGYYQFTLFTGEFMRIADGYISSYHPSFIESFFQYSSYGCFVFQILFFFFYYRSKSYDVIYSFVLVLCKEFVIYFLFKVFKLLDDKEIYMKVYFG